MRDPGQHIQLQSMITLPWEQLLANVHPADLQATLGSDTWELFDSRLVAVKRIPEKRVLPAI